MPLVVRYVEPRRERYPSTKHALPRSRAETKAKHGVASPPPVLPKEYQTVDKLLTTTSCLPILENASTNEIQAITIHRISSLIRQLSSLAQHAESVMGCIAEGLAFCHTRSTNLEARIKRLTEEVLPSLDPELEAMDGFEIPHPDFQFKSRKESNQFALTKHPPPQPLVLKIQSTHTPPLHLLSPLWPDGHNAKRLYTNPSFFFEQWKTSMKTHALRRKSSGHLLSPTSPTRHSKSNGIAGSGGRISPVGGPKKLKRSATVVSRSSRKKTRPLSYHSTSNLSLQDVGLSSSGKQTMIQRSFSMRKSPGYTYHSPAMKKPVKVPKSKHLGDPLSKTIAAVFPHVEVTVQSPSDTESIKSEKLQRGSGLRRSFSLRRSRSRSRSKSPNPPSVKGTPESVMSGAHMHTVDDGTKSTGSNDLAVLPKKQIQHLELGTTGFDTTLANGPKATSTFKTSSSSLSNRSVTRLVTRVSTPPNGQSSKGRPRISSDVREPARTSQRSMTVSGPNPSLKNVAARAREKVRSEGRPASMNLDIHVGDNFKLTESPLVKKTTSQSSLNVRTPSSQSNSSSGSRPRSMFVGDIEHPLPQEFAAKLTVSSQSQSRKPRRPAPPRPSGQDSGGRGTPDSARKGRTTPTLNASPIPMTSLDASKADSDSSSPIPNDPSTPSTVPDEPTTPNSNSPEKAVSDCSPEKGQSEASTEVKGPPPKPQRCDSLSNTKTARGAVTGSGPATPGTAHTAQIHSSLDAERKQSMAAALTEVLTNMNRRSLPVSPTTPPFVNGGINRVVSPDKSTPLDRTLTPVDKTPPNKGVFDLDATLTPFEHSPHFGMSPINVNTFRSPRMKSESTFGSPLGKLPPSKRRFSKRKSSLYISPHKLGTSPEESKSGFNVRAGAILKAGGVDNGILEDTRSDLLVAIRKGIQLKKVEEEAAKKNDEVSWDVAAILDRYEVLHDSDSEDEDEYDDEWLDD